jgi:hypothetical protein
MADTKKPPLDPNDPVVTIRRSGEPSFTLTLNEYRLALLGLVDFAGEWEALETATTFVVDGARKGALVRERLRPLAAHLDVLLARGVDGLELLAARHWFRTSEA